MSKPIEICVRSTTCTRFVISPEDGHTVDQILAMLNNGKVSLSPWDNSIVLHFPPPCEGMSVLARVDGHRVESDERKWEIASEPEGDDKPRGE